MTPGDVMRIKQTEAVSNLAMTTLSTGDMPTGRGKGLPKRFAELTRFALTTAVVAVLLKWLTTLCH